MKWKFYLFSLCCAVLFSSLHPHSVLAQQLCGDDISQPIYNDPAFTDAVKDFETSWHTFKNHPELHQFERSASGKYIIPVVVHVMHLGGVENISRNQIISQINAFNTNLGMLNAGLAALHSFPAFDSLVPYFNGADSVYMAGIGSELLRRFEFRLATRDPQGNCTDGIVRVYTDKTEGADNATQFKQLSYWNRAQYLNLWVVKSFPSPVLLAYAQFPFAIGGQFQLTSTDGITSLHDVFGNTGTASSATGATPVHEFGHWMGLFHIWGDDFCASDGIDDTPVHYGPNFCQSGTPPLGNPPDNTVAIGTGIHCPPSLPYTAECYVDTNSTDTILNALNLQRRHDIGRMWMNFMDYTSPEYQWMFTEQQYLKMNYTMTTVPFRGSLSDDANVLATGTDDASQASPCDPAPIADFWSRTGTNQFISKKLICAGQDLSFTNGTYNTSTPGSPSVTVAWQFSGGSPSTSAANAPVVTYANPGDFDVELTSTSSAGSSHKIWNEYVHVSPNLADETNIIYYDDFEYSTSLFEMGKWIILNEDNQVNTWQQTSLTGYMSSKCMVMKNVDNVLSDKDFLITPSYDLSTITNDRMYFRYAGARLTSTYIQQDDALRVYASTNCGESWTPLSIFVDGVSRAVLSGDTMYNAGLYPNGFIPSSPAHWKQAEVNIPASMVGSSNVRFMFEFKSGGSLGNDFYIDQVNITNSQAIGVPDVADAWGFKVYPNPVTTSGQVYFKLDKISQVSLDLLDMMGRVVKVLFAGTLESGENTFMLQAADIQSAGIYMVRLTVNGQSRIQKLMIQ